MATELVDGGGAQFAAKINTAVAALPRHQRVVVANFVPMGASLRGSSAAIKRSARYGSPSGIGRDEPCVEAGAGTNTELATHHVPRRQHFDKSLLADAEVEFCKLVGVRNAITVHGNSILSGRHIAIH